MLESLRKVFNNCLAPIKAMWQLCSDLATLAYYKGIFPITLRLKNVGGFLSSANGKELLKAPVRIIELVVLLFFSPTYAYHKGRSYWARTFGSVDSYFDYDKQAECEKGSVSSGAVFEFCDHLAALTFYAVSAPVRFFSKEEDKEKKEKEKKEKKEKEKKEKIGSDLKSKRPGCA